MANFIVSDIHGNLAYLWQLLNQEGLVDDQENLTEKGQEHNLYQVGDLLNAVLRDVHGDEECARVAQKWFDKVLVGNHEAPYLGHTAFNGYYEAPHLKSLYRQWMFEGFVVPALAFGNTLVTHAGVALGLDEGLDTAATAQEALDIINDAWASQGDDRSVRILQQVGPNRGGWGVRCGGITWADKMEPKVKTFSQVVGHTPSPEHHPVMTTRKDGTYTLYLDSGCKGGGVPSGVWLDDDGNVLSVVKMGVEEYQLPTPGFLDAEGLF